MSFPTDQWQSASVDQSDGNNEAPDPGPDGKASFDILLDDARAFVSKAGNAVIVLDMRVTGGPLDTYQWAELRGLKSEGQIKAAKATCARLGVDDLDTITGIEDLDSRLKECVGNYYEIEVVQNGEWRNVYVQGPANSTFRSDVPADVSAFTPTLASVPDEEVPF